MWSIGDFARHGGVSLRMLRPYDAIGLLPPARVDVGKGHRWYAAAQLDQLNRIVVPRDTGFGLARIRELLGVLAKPLPTVPVVELTGVAATFTPEDITPVIRPLGARLGAAIAEHGLRPDGNPLADYDLRRDGSERVGVHASFPVARGTSEVPEGLSYAVVPAADVAATIVHHGRMEDVLSSLGVG